MSEVGRDLWRWSTRVDIAKRQLGLAVERALWESAVPVGERVGQAEWGRWVGALWRGPFFPPLFTLPNSFGPFATRDQVWSLLQGQAIALTLTRNITSARARRERLR